MRMSRLFGRTLRTPPAEAELVSHRLLLRGGFVHPIGSGQYAYLPLGLRVVRRVETLLRREMARLEGQEVGLTLTPPHDAKMAALARREIQSYRDLPRLLYQIRAEAREVDRPRAGLLQARESPLHTAFSLHPDEEDLNRFFSQMAMVYQRTLALGCPVVRAEAGGGEGSGCEFLLPHPAGDTRWLHCPSCGYTADAGWAAFHLPPSPSHPLEEVSPIPTPDCATIADVASFVGVETSQTLKAVFYGWERPGQEAELVFVVIRGDLEVSEPKLCHLLGGGSLRPAGDDQIRAAGAEPGYASPVGLTVRPPDGESGIIVVGDRSIQAGANFVAGANRPGYHLLGVNYPRDLTVTWLEDVAQAREGFLCPRCETPLAEGTAFVLGSCIETGTRFTRPAGAVYTAAGGEERTVVMGFYTLDIGRLMAAAVESHHDEYGLIWPPSLAPYDVHLVALAGSAEEREPVEEVYERLREAGLAVLYDDRNERAGTKFYDADLIGCPVRVTIGRRSLAAGGAEVKLRWEQDRRVIPLAGLPETIHRILE